MVHFCFEQSIRAFTLTFGMTSWGRISEIFENLYQKVRIVLKSTKWYNMLIKRLIEAKLKKFPKNYIG